MPVSQAGETVHEPDAPKRNFFHHQVLAADFDQADTDKPYSRASASVRTRP